MKHLLSIDGGGIKGLIPAIILEEIERRINRPLHEVFDLMAGTSTGAIIVTALSMPIGMTAGDVARLYREAGPEIFRRPRPYLLRLKRAKYKGSNLYDVLVRHFGERVLSEARTRTMTTAYDVAGTWDEYGDPGPVFFKSWRPATGDVKAADAVQASAAAPAYFPPHRVAVPSRPEKEACLYDGGLFAGDPTMTAYAEARREFGSDELFVLSFGTGAREEVTECRRAVGLARIGQKVHGWMLDGSAGTVGYIARRVLPENEYVRLDRKLDRRTPMDDASPENLAYLEAHARRFVKENEDRIVDVCRRLRAHRPPV